MAQPTWMIHGGAQRQENLFHSFERFSLNEEQQAYFDNPIGVARIFSRITGSASSDIFGTLGVNGGADLFFPTLMALCLGQMRS